MARQKVTVEYNNFTRGYITEASPLTFPENASLDEENININRDGSRQRRFGMTWSSTAHELTEASPLSTTGEATNSFTWKGAGNDGDVNIGVLQKGRDLHFFDLEDTDPSGAFVATSTFSAGEVPSPNEDSPFSFTAAYGKLLVAVGTKTMYVFTWTGSGVTKTSYDIKVRDRWGIQDSLDVDERPTTLSDGHNYNLRNQGWSWSMRLANNAGAQGQPGGPATEGDPVARTNTDLGYFPANTDLVWALKMEHLGGATASIDCIGGFDALQLTKLHFGTAPAPKGRYVIDLFARGPSRDTESGGTLTLVADTTSGGITSVASYAGRVWYAVKETGLTGGDDNSPNLGNMVFYSQATDEESKWGACHMENDPASEDYNQILDSDGGFITIPEAGEILGLVPLGESMLVIASNGVWEIFGGETGFSASTQSVLKATDVGCVSRNSILKGDNLVAYWSDAAIMGIGIDQGSLRAVANSITEKTIQSYYDSIPVTRKALARGSYDFLSKQASWLYSLEDLGSDYYYDRELILDAATGSFTKRSIGTITPTVGQSPYVTAYLRLRKLVEVAAEVPVTAGGAIVTAGGFPVTVGESDAEQATQSSTMYWTTHWDNTDENFRLGGYLNFLFDDWHLAENSDLTYGVDSPAYLLTGYITGGDTTKEKWMPYVSVRMKRTETAWDIDANGDVSMVGASSCFLQAQWEWTNSANSNKWSRTQQVYRLPRTVFYDDTAAFNHDVVTTRNKVRGNGKAVSLKFSSERSKDLYLYGWGMDVLAKKET